MKATKEYFFTKLKEKLGGEVDYCCVIDGCYVFHLYHKKRLRGSKWSTNICRLRFQITLKRYRITQSMDMCEQVYKQMNDQT